MNELQKEIKVNEAKIKELKKDKDIYQDEIKSLQNLNKLIRKNAKKAGINV